MQRVLLALTASAVLLGGSATAKSPSFAKLPTLNKKAKASKLRLRIVEYTGGTNGTMVVEVRNTGAKPETFEAQGLFFVPKGDPEAAPQRLGAAGPFEARDGQRWKNQDKLQLAPKQTARLRLQVFCIDSHRSSPSSATKFRLAKKRLPKQLREQITSGTKGIMNKRKAKSARAVKGDVQSHVWQTRDKKWIKLEGERKQEKAVKDKRSIQRSRRHKRPMKIKRPLRRIE